MPAPYGVTATGFNPKSLQETKADIEAALRVTFGNGIDLSASTVFGQLIAVFADRITDAWQSAQAVYNAAFPDSATAVGLDRLVALTGVSRNPATFSLVSAVITGTPGTVVAAGVTASVLGSGAKFRTLSTATIGVGGTIPVVMQGSATGPRLAPAGTLTVIETPVSGVVSVTNALDQYQIGSDVESDGVLRLRRDLTLRAIGSASVEAIQAGLADLPGVTGVYVFENVTDFPVDSVPAHAFEAVVSGGTDAAISQEIFNRKPAGIQTYGNVSTLSAVDALTVGVHAVNFSRPVVLNVYVTINATVTANAPDNAATLIAAALVSFGDATLNIGSDLSAQSLVPSIFAACPGVFDCATPLIGLSASPTLSTTVAATPRQKIDLDTSRVVVNVTRI